jgi:hypothetical protein
MLIAMINNIIKQDLPVKNGLPEPSLFMPNPFLLKKHSE